MWPAAAGKSRLVAWVGATDASGNEGVDASVDVTDARTTAGQHHFLGGSHCILTIDASPWFNSKR
jgi:hypothetical protein